MILFGRYPVPEKAKTRLIPALGPAGAAEFHRALMEQSMRKARDFCISNSIAFRIYFQGGNPWKMSRWLGKDIAFFRQAQGHMGQKMHQAFEQAFSQGYHRVVLVGTDIPGLEQRHFQEAFQALSHNDLVLGPSIDGGYWLVGLRGPRDIFTEMDWNSKEILKQTISLAQKRNISFHLLDTLADIDTPSDLKREGLDALFSKPYLSVIIPTLNEEANIEKTIRVAMDPDVEILVVDGGSRDHTVSRAKGLGVRVMGSRPGRAVQQNAGADQAKGKTLLFLHADTLLPDRYVGHIFETLLERGVVAGAFRFSTDKRSFPMRVVEFNTNTRCRLFQLPYGDQGLFMPREVFEEAGGFPRVPIAEDLLLVRKLKKRGRIGLAPAHVLTSARRWKALGVVRTTLINQLIVVGIYLGISPATLASLCYSKTRVH